jgi:hypothetical protein
MPLVTPTFNDTTPASSLAVGLRRIAVMGAPKEATQRRGATLDNVSDGAAELANKALEILRDVGSAGLADWLVLRLSQDPDDLYASMVQRRFADALLAAGLVAPADQLDTSDLWTDSAQEAPVAPVAARGLGAPWAPRTPAEGERTFTPRVVSTPDR